MPTNSPHGLAGRTFGAVLFDLDGTLINSIGSVVRSWATWAGEYGLDPALLKDLHGVPAAGIIASLRADLTPEEQAVAVGRIEDLEVADTEGIDILPGTLSVLESLAAGGARVAIVTSCTDRLAEARLTATGLPRPAIIVTASQVARGKPHPDPFELGAQKVGVDPADCLVVEDAVSGLTSARTAGIGSALAVLHTTPRERLEPLADLVVSGLDAVSFRVDGDQRISVTVAEGRVGDR